MEQAPTNLDTFYSRDIEMTRCANAEFFKDFSAARILALVIVMFGLAACEARIASHGHSVDNAELDQIELGVSTRVDVLAGLGQPSFEGSFGANKLYYVSQIMIEPAGGKKTTQSRTVLAFSFDEQDVLTSLDVTDETTGNTVAHLDAKTPTPGDTFGLVDQIFSNLKRRRATE